MFIDDALGNTQSKPGALAWLLGRDKRLHELVADFYRNSGAAIRYQNADLLAFSSDGYTDQLLLQAFYSIEGIIEQI